MTVAHARKIAAPTMTPAGIAGTIGVDGDTGSGMSCVADGTILGGTGADKRIFNTETG
jgi:hypothetical protein